MQRHITLVLGLACLLLVSGCTKTEDRPATGKRASIDEIEKDIRSYIEQKTLEGDGYFHMNDRDTAYRMKLVRVHTEYLASLGPGSNFACVDLAEAGGDVYDVDFFLSGDPGNMKVTETTVHKLNGKPYYAWKQKADKTWYRLDMKDATPTLLGVKEGVDSFEFHYKFRLPEIKKKARLWLPIATSDAFQQVRLVTVEVPGSHRMLHDEANANTVLYSEFSASDSDDSVKISYQVRRMERGPVEAPKPTDKRYLESNALSPVGGRFADIAASAIKGRDGSDLMKARALYDYVIDNMRYMKYGDFGRGDSNYACDVKTGNCSEFHAYFISLARSIGIPARFAIGASIPSERNEGGIDGYHCWAEFYADGKWWPVDISEGNKYTALATYFFGHHPANRIELSRGRDLMLDPGPASGPVNFLAYPLLEVDGKTVKAPTRFAFNRK